MVNTCCAVDRCGSTSHKQKGIRFHQFPRDERCPAWISACKREDLKGKEAEQLRNMHICSLHFEQRMYGKHLLKKSAVPTLNLPQILTHTAATQTETFDPSVFTPIFSTPGMRMSTSQGVQTDDDLFYVFSDNTAPAPEPAPAPAPAPEPAPVATPAPEVPTSPYCCDYNQQVYYEKDGRIDETDISALGQSSSFLTLEQFLEGCDAFLPDGLTALIRSHVALSLEYNDAEHTLAP